MEEEGKGGVCYSISFFLFQKKLNPPAFVELFLVRLGKAREGKHNA